MRNHTGEKPYSYSECGYRTQVKHNLLTLMKNDCDVKPYACHQCNYSSKHKTDLEVCMIRIHTVKKLFACTMSDYKVSCKTFSTLCVL